MKNALCLLVLGVFLTISVSAQQDITDRTESSISRITQLTNPQKYIDITVGAAPKSPYEAVKFSASINNLILNRIGFYTSFEKGFNENELTFHYYDDHKHFSNILGVTATLNQYVYFWGGIDVFTKSGVIACHGERRGFRKELGVGITPYKWTVARLGWSKSVGPTFTIGAKIPIGAN